MKFATVAALGVAIFQNFEAEAVKIVSADCPKGLCVVEANDDHKYTLDEASKKAVYDALRDTEFKESDSKLTGTVKINGQDVNLTFDQQKK
jgi:hypothetical protein